MANSVFRVFVTLLRGRVHLILANPPWRQLQERAQKIQGDKKHIEGIFSQNRYGAQFRTAHNRPTSTNSRFPSNAPLRLQEASPEKIVFLFLL